MKRANLTLISLAFLASASLFTACNSSGATTTTTMATVEAATPNETPTNTTEKTTPTQSPTKAPNKSTPVPTPTEAAAKNTPVPTATKAPSNTPAPTATEVPASATATPAPTEDSGSGQTLPTANCLSRLQEAESVPEADRYVERYYPALKECTGVADWVAAVTKTAALDGEDPVAWASKVCALDGPMLLITCQQAMTASPIADVAENENESDNTDTGGDNTDTGGDNTDTGDTDGDGTSEQALPSASCLARLQQAESVPEAERYVELYYPALKECTGLDDWVAAVSETGALGGEDPIAWASKICGVDGPMNSVTCQQAMAASPRN